MRKIIYIGVDPGLDGGVGVLYPEGDALAVDTPVIKYKTGGKTKAGNAKTKTDYDGPGIIKVFEPFAEAHRDPDSEYDVLVVLENVHAMHKDTGLTGFSLGRAKGILEGIFWALGLPCEMVSPSQWKPAMVGTGADKEASRIRAQKLFPKAELHLKKHHGRAEALLMAEFYRRKRENESMPQFRRVKKTKKVKKKVKRG